MGFGLVGTDFGCPNDTPSGSGKICHIVCFEVVSRTVTSTHTADGETSLQSINFTEMKRIAGAVTGTLCDCGTVGA